MQAVAVYPACVLLVLFIVSFASGWLVNAIGNFQSSDWGWQPPVLMKFLPWVVPALLSLVGAVWLFLRFAPGWRTTVPWMIPMLRDARVAGAADTLAVLVRQGCPFPDAVALLLELEQGTPLAEEMARWQRRMAGGASRFPEIAVGTDGKTIFPPLFPWLVSQSGSRLEDGFSAAGRFYGQRARHRVDLLLHGALPVATILLGVAVVAQCGPVFLWMVGAMGGDNLGDGF
jgi:type II secretory pathway component PulF